MDAERINDGYLEAVAWFSAATADEPLWRTVARRERVAASIPLIRMQRSRQGVSAPDRGGSMSDLASLLRGP